MQSDEYNHNSRTILAYKLWCTRKTHKLTVFMCSVLTYKSQDHQCIPFMIMSCHTHSSTKDPRELNMSSGRVLRWLSCNDLCQKRKEYKENISLKWEHIFYCVKGSKTATGAWNNQMIPKSCCFLVYFLSYFPGKGEMTLSTEIPISFRKSHLRCVWDVPTSFTAENGTS